MDETIKLIEVSILSNIEITVEKGAGVQPIMGSPIQLQQILINLTTNSYQAMKSSGGSITIALHRKHIGTEMHLSHGVLSPGHYSVLSVADNGPGMSSEVASRIFEPYFTTKAHGEGSGMGMAIVYNLVKAHSASLDLKTAPGEGTCITLYFKETSDIGAAADAANSVAVVRGQGERILLVDDEEDLLEGTQQLLSSIGYRVTAFSDPDVALQTFERAPLEFDLLLTDQSMPKITGMQLLEHVVELNPLIAVIICTGYSDSINQQELGHGALNSVLRKPYTLGEISSAISSALTAQR